MITTMIQYDHERLKEGYVQNHTTKCVLFDVNLQKQLFVKMAMIRIRITALGGS